MFVDTKRNFYFGQHDFLMRVNRKYIFCLGHMYILPVNVSLHLSTDGVKDVVFLCCCISIRIGNPFSWASGIPVVSLGEIKWPKNHRWGVTAKQRSAEIKETRWDLWRPLHVDSDLRRNGNGMWIPRQRSASLSLLSSWDHTLFLSFLVSIQQQHTAADRGQGWPPLSVVHAELQEAVQSRQTPQTVPLPLHLQLRGERCTPAVAHVLHCQFDQSFPTNQIPVLSDMFLR